MCCNQLYKETQKKYLKEYRKKKIWKQYYNQWRRTYYKNNPQFRINNSMATLTWMALKNKKAGRSWEKLTGYTAAELMNHLEKQFDKKMNWENYDTYWTVDHIKPRTLFKYKTAEEEGFKKCWALRNLQPLEKTANNKKSNHYK